MQDNRPLLPDDVFRTKLDRTIAALRQWGQGVSDCAKVAEVQEKSHWWFVAIPHAPGACRFELVVHHNQKHDIAINHEPYEDRGVEELDRLLPMAEAIAAGNVFRRFRRSANTGAHLAIETIVRLPGDQLWQADRWLVPGKPLGRTTLDDRWFLPYRR